MKCHRLQWNRESPDYHVRQIYLATVLLFAFWNQLSLYADKANSEGSDQAALMRDLVWAFVIRYSHMAAFFCAPVRKCQKLFLKHLLHLDTGQPKQEISHVEAL